MFKLVSRQPPVPPQQPLKGARPRDEVRLLHRRIEENRALGQSTQRAVARGRHTVVEVHCRMQRGAFRSGLSAKGRSTVADRGSHLSELARTVEEIHKHLLSLSTSVELEMDHLDLVRAEIDQITTDSRIGRQTS
jgi:hypothetical protein